MPAAGGCRPTLKPTAALGLSEPDRPPSALALLPSATPAQRLRAVAGLPRPPRGGPESGPSSLTREGPVAALPLGRPELPAPARPLPSAPGSR